METTGQTKFIFLESIDQNLLESGLSETWANAITFMIACGALLVLVWILKIIGSKFVSWVLRRLIRHTESKLDSFLLNRNFYRRLIYFVSAVIVRSTTKILFRGFHENLIKTTETAIDIYLIFIGVKLLFSVLNTANDIYETKPQAKTKSIRTFIQSIQIVTGVIAAITVIAMLVGSDTKSLFIGLGTSAAIVSLIFRDIILGFVASLQVSAQDMIRPGDWIEMPSRSADGIVAEINIMNIKVKNWDNSLSMIPTYSLISESFTNWRNMQESTGRRFRRPLLIDINSMKTLSPKEMENIINHPAIPEMIALDMIRLTEQNNTSSFVTNIGLYRSYIEAYLHHHPKVVQDHLRVARYLDNTENGMVIQVYGYSTEKTLTEYERVVSDIFENIQMVSTLFGVRFYQRPVAVENLPDEINTIQNGNDAKPNAM